MVDCSKVANLYSPANRNATELENPAIVAMVTCVTASQFLVCIRFYCFFVLRMNSTLNEKYNLT